MISKEALKFVFINGKGSSGKDTQAEILRDKYEGAVRISTGNIYRGARTLDGEFGRFHHLLAPYIASVDAGGFFPDGIMLDIVQQVIGEEVAKGNSLFLFTGFPRTVAQLEGVDEMMRRLSNEHIVDSMFVCFAVLDHHARERADNRRRQAEML